MEWIKVSDKLLDEDCICVVFNENRVCKYYIAFFSTYCKEFEIYMLGGMRLSDPLTFNATHWCKIEDPII